MESELVKRWSSLCKRALPWLNPEEKWKGIFRYISHDEEHVKRMLSNIRMITSIGGIQLTKEEEEILKMAVWAHGPRISIFRDRTILEGIYRGLGTNLLSWVEKIDSHDHVSIDDLIEHDIWILPAYFILTRLDKEEKNLFGMESKSGVIWRVLECVVETGDVKSIKVRDGVLSPPAPTAKVEINGAVKDIRVQLIAAILRVADIMSINSTFLPRKIAIGEVISRLVNNFSSFYMGLFKYYLKLAMIKEVSPVIFDEKQVEFVFNVSNDRALSQGSGALKFMGAVLKQATGKNVRELLYEIRDGMLKPLEEECNMIMKYMGKKRREIYIRVFSMPLSELFGLFLGGVFEYLEAFKGKVISVMLDERDVESAYRKLRFDGIMKGIRERLELAGWDTLCEEILKTPLAIIEGKPGSGKATLAFGAILKTIEKGGVPVEMINVDAIIPGFSEAYVHMHEKYVDYMDIPLPPRPALIYIEFFTFAEDKWRWNEIERIIAWAEMRKIPVIISTYKRAPKKIREKARVFSPVWERQRFERLVDEVTREMGIEEWAGRLKRIESNPGYLMLLVGDIVSGKRPKIAKNMQTYLVSRLNEIRDESSVRTIMDLYHYYIVMGEFERRLVGYFREKFGGDESVILAGCHSRNADGKILYRINRYLVRALMGRNRDKSDNIFHFPVWEWRLFIRENESHPDLLPFLVNDISTESSSRFIMKARKILQYINENIEIPIALYQIKDIVKYANWLIDILLSTEPPDTEEIEKALFHYLQIMDRLENFREAYKRVQNVAATSFDGYMIMKGFYEALHGNKEQGLKLMKKAKGYPELKAFLYARLGEIKEAVSHTRNITRLAYELTLMEMCDNALMLLQNAEKNAYTLGIMGLCSDDDLMSVRYLSNAIKACRNSVDLSVLLIKRGIYYTNLSMYKKAINDFSKAIKMIENVIAELPFLEYTYIELNAYNNIVAAYNDNGEIDKAKDVYSRIKKKWSRLVSRCAYPLYIRERVTAYNNSALQRSANNLFNLPVSSLLGYFDDVLDIVMRIPDWKYDYPLIALVDKIYENIVSVMGKRMYIGPIVIDKLIKSIELCKELVQRDPRPHSLSMLANAYIRLGIVSTNTKEAAKNFNEGIRILKKLVDETHSIKYVLSLVKVYFAIFSYYVFSDRIMQAIKTYAELITLLESLRKEIPSLKLLWSLGNAYFTRALAYREIGLLKDACNDLDRAIALMSEVVKENPFPNYMHELASAYFERGTIWLDKYEYERALEDYEKGIEYITAAKINDELAARLYGNRGYTLEMMGRYKEAFKDYTAELRAWEAVLQENPRDMRAPDGIALAYCDRGIVLEYMGRYKEAFKEYTRALEAVKKMERYILDSEFHGYFVYLRSLAGRGRIYARKKRYKEALEEFREAIEFGEKVLPHGTIRYVEVLCGVYLDVAEIYLKQGKLDSARKYVKRAIKTAKENLYRGKELLLVMARAYWTLVEIEKTAGNKKEAEKYREEALKTLEKISQKILDREWRKKEEYQDLLKKLRKERTLS